MIKPVRRRPVNKSRSARQFRKSTSRTRAVNMPGLARGGWRL